MHKTIKSTQLASGTGTLFWTRGGGGGGKKKLSFCPQIAKHLHYPEMFNGSRVLHIL